LAEKGIVLSKTATSLQEIDRELSVFLKAKVIGGLDALDRASQDRGHQPQQLLSPAGLPHFSHLLLLLETNDGIRIPHPSL
jgi:hypothetical protein